MVCTYTTLLAGSKTALRTFNLLKCTSYWNDRCKVRMSILHMHNTKSMFLIHNREIEHFHHIFGINMNLYMVSSTWGNKHRLTKRTAGAVWSEYQQQMGDGMGIGAVITFCPSKTCVWQIWSKMMTEIQRMHKFQSTSPSTRSIPNFLSKYLTIHTCNFYNLFRPKEIYGIHYSSNRRTWSTKETQPSCINKRNKTS